MSIDERQPKDTSPARAALPRPRRASLTERYIRGGAGLLGLALIVHVMLGPWGARWYLAVLWLAIALGWGAARRRGWATLGLPVGFAALAAAIVARSLGWSSPWILGPLYAVVAGAAAVTLLSKLARGRQPPGHAPAEGGINGSRPRV